MTEVDYLTEDTLVPKGQNYVCISFLSDKDKKLTLTGVKVRGIFNKYDDAAEHAKKIQSVDPYNHVYVGEAGKWLPYDPDPNSEAAGDPEYANKKLNQIMKSQIENQEKSKIHHEKRKNELISKNLQENILTRKSNKEKIVSNLGKAKTDQEKDSIQQTLEAIDREIKKLEDKKEEASKKVKKLEKKLNDSSEINTMLKQHGPSLNKEI
jgi:hypothetical protein